MQEPQIENSSSATTGHDAFVLITGASSGIGACFARALAARGWPLVLVARSKDKLEALARGIVQQHTVRIEVIDQDLSLQGAADRLVTVLKERGIIVDLLVQQCRLRGARRILEAAPGTPVGNAPLEHCDAHRAHASAASVHGGTAQRRCN